MSKDNKARMKAPEGGASCSFEGTEYEADKEGVVEVPQEAVAVLQSHGYVLVPKKETKK